MVLISLLQVNLISIVYIFQMLCTTSTYFDSMYFNLSSFVFYPSYIYIYLYIDFQVISEILTRAYASQATDSSPALLDILKAYEEVLTEAGRSLEDDLVYFPFLLKLNLRPGADWWTKVQSLALEHEQGSSSSSSSRKPLLRVSKTSLLKTKSESRYKSKHSPHHHRKKISLSSARSPPSSSLSSIKSPTKHKNIANSTQLSVIASRVPPPKGSVHLKYSNKHSITKSSKIERFLFQTRARPAKQSWIFEIIQTLGQIYFSNVKHEYLALPVLYQPARYMGQLRFLPRQHLELHFKAWRRLHREAK